MADDAGHSASGSDPAPPGRTGSCSAPPPRPCVPRPFPPCTRPSQMPSRGLPAPPHPLRHKESLSSLLSPLLPILAQYELIHTRKPTVATALPRENVTEDQRRSR